MSYAARKPQSRTETEANARILRTLVRQAENRVCADCKRNDTRWASWNVGCFLCIRCSGIHRSMGTHISRVKSIDLDIWTPEQMASMQKWGNHRANLYWEAYLKQGHIPPDHRVESFIRSKYEGRRWALKSALPDDPSVLERGTGAAPAATTAPQAAPAPAAAPAPKTDALLDLLLDNPPDAARPPAAAAKPDVGRSPAAAPAAQGAAAPAVTNGRGGGLFDLDWDDAARSAPAVGTAAAPSAGSARGKDAILSLFSAQKPAPPASSLASAPAPTNLESQLDALRLDGPAATRGTGGVSGVGRIPRTRASSSGGGALGASAPPSGTDGANALLHTQDVWGTASTTTPVSGGRAPADDAFADIWGDFK
ncbi:ARF GAP with effector function(s) [Malassezia sp. CBS 17886]|nr:ARF GAP with effector function(s) [Malassezia sp. CBS 17886]